MKTFFGRLKEERNINIIAILIGIVATCFFGLAYFVIGVDSYVEVHDQLDGEVLNYIYQAKYIFAIRKWATTDSVTLPYRISQVLQNLNRLYFRAYRQNEHGRFNFIKSEHSPCGSAIVFCLRRRALNSPK